MNKLLLILITISSVSSVYATETFQIACLEYQKVMKSIPHTKITYEKNFIITTHENKTYDGCSVTVDTKWSLVGKNFTQESVLDLPGWGNGDFVADGAGTSIYKRVKGNLFCMVGYSFSSYIDEKTRKFVTGDNLRMYAECAEK